MKDTKQYLLDNDTHRVVEVPEAEDILLMLKLKIEQLQNENDRLMEEIRHLKNTIAMLQGFLN